MLLLRCTLLAALALALAGLQWTPQAPTPSRWCLLLPGTHLRDTHLRDWTRLRNEGFEARWIAPGFPRIADPSDSPAPDPRTPVWPLLQEADARLAPGSEAWVFGPTWSSLFNGNRPSTTNLRVQWHEVPTPPPVTEPAPDPRVGVVHAPERAVDATYVRAALRAMGARVVTHEVTHEMTNEVPDWIFQLGSSPLPLTRNEFGTQGVRIVQDPDETSVPARVSRRIEVALHSVPLRQRVAPGPGAPLFRDSQGDPWLTEERHGTLVRWHVAFRFHPDWTDWPLDGAFPAWWQEHLRPPPPSTAPIAPEQAAPRHIPDPDSGVASTLQPPASIDLRAASWLLGAALFLVERRLSRSTPETRDTTSTSTATSTAPGAT